MKIKDHRIKAVIWDMGGVLLRTEDHSRREVIAARLGVSQQELGKLIFASESAKLATIGTISASEHWKNVGQALSLSDQELELLRVDYWAGDEMDALLLDYIRGLRPKYKTGLLSNAWSDARKEIGARFDFLDAFDVSIFSAELKMAKPDAAIYHWVLEQLAVKPAEAVFIDDFVENIEAAGALGIHAVWFQNQNQVLRDLGQILSV